MLHYIIESGFLNVKTEILNVVISAIISSGFLGAFLTYATKRIQKINEETSRKMDEQRTRRVAVEKGVQALLRDRLLYLYDKYMEKEYAPSYIKDNFDNMYQRYHVLGQNGVMDDAYDKFMKLPTISPHHDDNNSND